MVSLALGACGGSPDSSSSSSSSSSGVSINLPLVLAINAGSTSSASYDGITYEADKYSRASSGASSTTESIIGVSDGTMFQTERWGTYSYEIPVTDGTYSVKLHHAELYHDDSGLRSFNLSVEGRPVLSNMDLFDDFGRNVAYTHAVEDINVNDGVLDITLEGVVDNGTLSGFAIYSNNGEIDTSVPVSNCSGYVGLTYDDGPQNTARILQALRDNNLSPVTFFVNGERIAGKESAIQQMIADGHQVQNHAFYHEQPMLNGMSVADATDSLKRTSDLIVSAGGSATTILRPPRGQTSNNIESAAASLGMIVHNWSIDAMDYNGASTADVVNSVGQLQDGQDILMHTFADASINAIPQIAALLKSKGLCPGRLDPNTARAVAP